MDGGGGRSGSGEPLANGEITGGRVELVDIEFSSDHGIMRGCGGEDTWKNEGARCAAPEWTAARQFPISHSMGEGVDLTIRVRAAALNGGGVDIRGEAPGALWFGRDDVIVGPEGARARMVSSRPLPRRIGRFGLGIRWSADGVSLSPARTDNVVYVTMSRPLTNEQGKTEEDGVTLKRMARAVSWVEPLNTLRPHSIVRALMGKFPYYSLKPSTKVPRQYHHPTFFNDEGGAWAMSDYVEETGECQAIVRLVRGILRQLGVPGEARTLLVWADPEVDGGRRAVTAYWDEDPSAGLDRTKTVGGRRWLATLVDRAVEVGKVYPASHTLENGRPSPGFNRYEACLEFTHEGVTRQYGGGAGVFQTRDAVLHAFWGLAWVSEAPNDGFRVEEIVVKYR